jgi:hypothetical protein
MRIGSSWSLWAGVALIVLGLFFFLGQFLEVNLLRYLWPLFIIAAGAAFFVGMASGGQSAGPLAVPGSVITTVGLILFVQNAFGIWASWAYAWGLVIAGAGLGLILFGRHSSLPDLIRAGRVVIIIGLALFFVFGTFFEIGAGLLGLRSPGGVLWAVMLILFGIYLLLSRTIWARPMGGSDVTRSEVTFTDAVVTPTPPAATDSVSAPVASTAVAATAAASAAAASAAAPPPETPPAGQAAPAIDPGEPGVSTAPVSGIHRVRFRAIGDLTILQGEDERLEIEAHQAIRERVRTTVNGDQLEISFDNNWWDWVKPQFWNISTPIRFTLTVREMSALENGGVGKLVVNDFGSSRLEILQSGAGTVELRSLDAGALRVVQSGLGNISADGRVEQQHIIISGAGSYQAGRLESISAAVQVSGIGSATLWVRDTLHAQLSGTGSIEYYGSPRVNQAGSGLGSVRRLGER